MLYRLTSALISILDGLDLLVVVATQNLNQYLLISPCSLGDGGVEM